MRVDEKRISVIKERIKDAWQTGDMIQAFEKDLDDLLSDRAELLGALRKYGKHKNGCDFRHSISCSCACICGLSQFLEGEKKNGL